MRRKLAGLLFLGLAACFAGGCAVHPLGRCGPACPDIRAAAKIDLSSERLIELKKIAAHQPLSQHEQTYLVNAMIFGGFGGEPADALITLINNPYCTWNTRNYISDNLTCIMFSHQRTRVAQALAKASEKAPPS
jgi:hypothetical protein